jgi:plasmid maintenance system killer protein
MSAEGHPIQHELRVNNNQRRVVFHWDSSRGEARDIYLDDHS